MRHLLPVFCICVASVLAACSPGPDYVRPEAEVPATFKQAGRWQAAAVDAPLPQEKWWQAFDDPVLDGLVEQVMLDNQNLKQAEARYRAARATLDSARSAFFPTVSLAATANRGNTAAAASVSTPATTTYSLSALASWEIDVWGRIRRNVESADANLAASAADLGAARLSTQALLAQTFIQMRAAEAQLDLLQRTIGAYGRFLELTRNRFAAGVASQLDVAQADTQLSNVEAQAIDAENQRAQFEHAIAVLVGRPPAVFAISTVGRLPSAPAIPELIPSLVLEHRPDIAAAERRMAAANAQIGVAAAAYFPVLDLAGAIGYRNSALWNLIDAPSRYWSVIPTLAGTLFDGGARQAAVSQATAGYDQTVAAYRQTVLTAFQEVEDNLAAARLLTRESEIQERALAAARRSRLIAENQYRAGIGSALNVVTAQSAELFAEVTSIATSSRRLQATVQLYVNAGGPWAAPVVE